MPRRDARELDHKTLEEIRIRAVEQVPYGPETGSAWSDADSSPRIEARDNDLSTCRESWIHFGSW